MLTRTLRYRCTACGNGLVAPGSWAGRSASCPRCSGEHAVPERDDPDAARPALDLCAAPPADDEDAGIAELSEIPPPAPPKPRRGSRLRRLWLVAAVLIGVAGTGVAGYQVYKSRFGDAASNQRHRHHGHYKRMGYPNLAKLERRHAEDPTNEKAARRLAAAYERVIGQAGERGRKSVARVYNNAAWLYVTTEVASVRDLERGLRYAKLAAAATDGTDAVVLDTLAEALHRNGDSEAALRVAEKAVELRPDLPDLAEHLSVYRDAVGE